MMAQSVTTEDSNVQCECVILMWCCMGTLSVYEYCYHGVLGTYVRTQIDCLNVAASITTFLFPFLCNTSSLER